MIKRYLAVALSALTIAGVASPAVSYGYVTPGLSASKTSDATNPAGFYLMKNGDYSLGGKGSVSEELEQYDLDFASIVDRKHWSVLAFAESSGKVFIYISAPYSTKEPTLPTFDTISACVASNNEDKFFKNYTLNLSSYDASMTYFKYFVKGLNAISGNRTYSAREIFTASKKSDPSTVYPLSASFSYDGSTGKTVLLTDDYLDINKKSVAYELIPINTDFVPCSFQQVNYCLFSFTDNSKLDKINKIACSYNYHYFAGQTSISADGQSTIYETGYDRFNNVDLEKNIKDANTLYLASPTYSEDYSEVSAETITLNQYDPIKYVDGSFNWLSFIKPSSTIDLSTIVDISKSDVTNWSDSNVMNYQYCLRFKSNKFQTAYKYGDRYYQNANPLMGIAGGWVYKATGDYFLGFPASWRSGYYSSAIQTAVENKGALNGSVYVPQEDYSPVQIEDFSLLQFWYSDVTGEPKTAIIIDAYNDTAGGHQITEPQDTTSESGYWKTISSWWEWATSNWPKSALVLAGWLALIILVISIFVYLIKGGAKKIVEWLFSSKGGRK